MINYKSSYKQQLNEVWSLMDRLCETTLLLEAMSLDDIHAKYYSDIDKNLFDKIVAADPTSNVGTGKKGKYCMWLLNLYRKGNLNPELELSHANEYLKIANRLNGFDINSMSSVADLFNKVEPYINGKSTSKSEEERKIKEGADKVYEDNEWVVIVPHTKEAAIYYGKGTKWCTAATESRNWFDRYNKEGFLYININKRTHEKYQFHFENAEFKNEANQNVTNHQVGISEGLESFYIRKYCARTYSFFDESIPKFISRCENYGTSPIRQFIEMGVLSDYMGQYIEGHFDIPDGTKKIGDDSFTGLSKLTSVTIPDSVTTIGWGAFRSSGLKEVTIPDSVTEIELGCFARCRNLSSVTIGNSVKSIDDNAFGHTPITSIDIPESVENIASRAFMECSKLRKVVINNPNAYVGLNVFQGCNDLTIYVRSERLYRTLEQEGYHVRMI